MTNDDLDRELRTHLDLEAEERREAGLSAEEAAYAARRALGSVTLIKEDVRALSPRTLVDDFVQDLRYGGRVLLFVDFRSVSPGYFAAMSIPLGAGRDVAWSDTGTTQPSIVISETMARTFWPNQNAIGKRIKLGRPDEGVPWVAVVGIVGDVRQFDLARVPRPAMYLPPSQGLGTGDTLRDWVVRTSGDPVSLASPVRSAVWAIDPALPITRMQTLAQVRSASTASQRFSLVLVGLFAGLGLLLAAIGLYGVTAYTVEQRTRELGIRIALGAQRGELLRLVLTRGVQLTIIGLGVGTVAAFALTSMMSTLLFGVGAHDPVTFASVGVLLIVVSLVASFIPSHRAMRVDPMIALRVG